MPSTETLATQLRDAGYRLTGPRLTVWNTLVAANGHLTAEEIVEQAREADPTVNVSSVYRSLSLFDEMGIVRETNLAQGSAAHWEIAHPDEQFHLRCVECGRVQHHTGSLVASIESHLAESHGFTSHSVELLVSGVCDRCQS